MKKCEKCSSLLEDNVKFCGKCGSPTPFNNIEKIATPIGLDLADKKYIVTNEKLKGLGGWLLLILIGFFYMGYSYGSLALRSIGYFTDGTVEKLSAIQGYAGALGFEVSMQIIMFLFLCYLLFLFINRKDKFTKYFIIFAIANLFFIALDTYIIAFALNYPTEEIKQSMQGAIQDGYSQLARAAVYAVIWIWYMKVSKRVKLTFIEK